MLEDDGDGSAELALISPLSGPQGVWATQFVQVSLKAAFGPIVQLVGDSLLSRGAQSLEELFKHTRLDVPTLKKSLLTLLQQDLAQPSYEKIVRPGGASAAAAAAAAAAASGAKPKKVRPPRVLYALNCDAARQRARYAHYLLWIKQCFGPECEYILQTLLVHGKLTSAQVMDLTFSSITEKNRLAAQELHRIQVQAAVAAAAAAGNSAPVKPPPPPPPPAPSAFDRRRIHDVFRQLIASRYIKRAQGLTPPAEAPSEAEAEAAAAAAAAGGGSSSINGDILKTFLANSAAAIQKDTNAREEAAAIKAANAAQVALRASTAAAVAADKPVGKKRKKIVVDDEDEEGGAAAAGEDGAAAAATPTKPAAKKPKKKTKKELEQEAKDARAKELADARARDEADTQASLERAGAAAASSSGDASSSSAAAAAGGDNVDDHGDGHILWSVNHAQFLWEFRKKAVIDYVSEAHSPACGFVVAQLLHQYPPDCCNPQGGERPAIYDTDAIVTLCERAADTQQVRNPVPNAEVAEECLHQMLGDSSNFFERKTHPKGYLINFPALFNELRLKHIQSLCRSRYGSLAARLFRCLLVHKRLEETQLSEYATAPRKDVRRLLYTMYNASLISLQEIPRSSDRMPQKTFYLWGVATREVCQHYLESLYFSWCNLRMRIESETDAAKHVLDKVDTSKVITAAEKETVDKWKKGADRLELGLHQLNQLIMLFQDF